MTIRRRVAVLTNIPAPYRLKLFEMVAREHDLKVFFDCETEPNREWKTPDVFPFPHRTFRTLQIPYWRKRPDKVPGEWRYRNLPYSVLPGLRQFNPDLVVAGELGIRTLQASLYCWWVGCPLIIWWEGTQHTEGWVAPAVRIFRRLLVRSADRFWANGQEAASLLESYGASRNSIDQGMIGSDTRSLSLQLATRFAERASLRLDLGVSGTVFLFVGRFVKPKGLLPFLAALEHLKQNTASDFSVLFVGGGPETALLESWQKRHPGIRTQILSFQQSGKLAELQAASDVFVMPTLDDNWSLVALEAAVAGLPQVLSRFNGAASDLLARGVKGICVNPFEIEKFADVLKQFVESPPERVDEQERSALAEYFSSEALAARACRSIEQALLCKPPK